MNDINKRLVEVEVILKKLDKESLSKIPQEIWDYINENKDTNYIYKFNDKVPLTEQNINVVTIAILTYINIEYLLDDLQKKDLQDFLRRDDLFFEIEKRKKYNSHNLFNKTEELLDKQDKSFNSKQDIVLAKSRNNFFTKLKRFFTKILHSKS